MDIVGSYLVPDDNNTWADLNHRPIIMDPSYLMDRYPMGENLKEYEHCKRPAKCFRMSNATCMGAKLPYQSTTLDLIPEYINQEIINEKLYMLQSLRHIPKCWSIVQPFLCSLFAPRCINDTVDLPSQEMCKLISGPCGVLSNHTIWPNFIKCDDAKLFPRRCKNDFRDLKFDTKSKCLDPLVPSDNSLAVFEGIEGCAIPCSDPLYTNEEKKQINSFIYLATSICFGCTLFAVITFLIDRHSSNKYPAVAIFYINFCIMISSTGWLTQFLAGNRDVISCRKDGTLRISEPSGENLMCVVVFLLIYYSSVAAMVWFVIFTYTWYISFNSEARNVQAEIYKKCAYFHLLAWCLPLILTVTIMAMGEIDGNNETGICFVGYRNHVVRAFFVLVPVSAVVLVGGYFLVRGLIKLVQLKRGSRDFITEKVSSKMRDNIIRMGLFSIFTLVPVVLTFYCHVYDFQHSWMWKRSFREYMMCSITSNYTDGSECKIQFRPSAAKLQLHLLAPFFTGILMSSWVWTSSTIEIWIRFIKRVFNRNTEEPLKLQKHKVIAQTFAKRKMFKNSGRLSISFHNTHQDPVDLNFDLNSVASQGFSSTWAAALPKLVSRRGALVDAVESSNQRNSVDSQYSFSLRHVSVESRRNSCDSQFAVSISELKAEMKTTRNKRSKKSMKRSRDRSLTYKRRRAFERSRIRSVSVRRESTTSQDSQMDSQMMSASRSESISNAIALPAPNMERRAALNERIITRSDAKRFFPFLFSSNEKTNSDKTESEHSQT